MSNQQNSNMNDDNKYLYEKAIEGRQFHMECFNHWMNMYAIINGALFAGLYTVKEISHTLSILVLGCLAGWFWHFSVHGFYRWIISWVKIVSHYEEKLFSNETSKNEHLVYKIFDEDSKEEDREEKLHSDREEKKNKKKNKKKMYPFSTQKLTRAFTLCVAIVWTVLLAYSIHKISGKDFFIPEIAKFLSSWVFWITLGVILIIVILMATLTNWKIIGLRENLTGNHETFDKAKKKQKQQKN